MADRKKMKDVDSDAPGGVTKEQGAAGTSSGGQGAGAGQRAPKQSPQTSNRPGKVHEHEPTVRKGYEDAQNPEPQGDGDPGPDPVSDA
ncbi:MAG TPA: hypothetical protein VK912_02480 [Longimicrobiales bacterium]|nr:hypothetical protein [Longimicrobiales bacterium]